MDLLSKHSKIFFLAAGAAVITAAGFFFLSKKEEKALFNLTDSEKTAALQKIKIEYINDQYLTLSTIGQILDATVAFAAPGYLELTKRDRNARRAVLEDFPAYVELRDDFAKSIGQHIVNTQKEILNELGLSYELWEESNAYYQSQGVKELAAIHQSVPAKLRNDLKATKTLTKEEIIEIIKAQTDLISKEIEVADNYKALNGDPRKIITIAQCRIKDHIYERFGIEDEDLTKGFKDYSVDQDIRNVVNESRQFSQRLETMLTSGLFE